MKRQAKTTPLIALLLAISLLGTTSCTIVRKNDVSSTQAEDATTANPKEEPTAEPMETTTEPEEATVEPEEATVEPEETTEEPEETTEEPEETTEEPEETTEEPEETTREPEETTRVPEETTREPEETTEEPEETTEEPEETTEEPEETTREPEETTEEPEETTADPEEETTEEPEEETTHTHIFSEWGRDGEEEQYCEDRRYSRVCSDCTTVEWKQGTADDHDWTVVTTAPTCQAGGYDTGTCNICGKVEITNETPVSDHIYPDTYESDNSFHWHDCVNCDHTTEKVEHSEGDTCICTVCEAVIGATEGIVYEVSEDGTYAMVIDYTGTATRVRIAEEYNGVPVTEIYQEAFKNTDITSVEIPDSVTTIGDKAFYSCDSLTSVEIGDGVTTIGEWAFYSCDSLTSVEIGDGVTTIGEWAFYDCDSLTSVELPDSVTTIGYEAFYSCRSMTTVVIGNSVTTIGEGAFYGCDSLTSVELPDSVTTIGDEAFYGCTSLTDLYITNVENWLNGNFADVFVQSVKKHIMDDEGNEITELFIPDSVTTIGSNAFRTCSWLASVEIGDNVTRIGNMAFYGCSLLTSVKISDSMTHIGVSAFHGCSSLTSMVIPDSVTSIGSRAFYECSSLTTVVIGDNVSTIAYGAFYDCSLLTSVYYTGTAETWEGIGIGDSNDSLTSATRYYYSSIAPTEAGNYWHYVDGVPTPW